MWVWAQLDWVDLCRVLVVDSRLDEVWCEDVVGRQSVVVAFEVVEYFGQRVWYLLDEGVFLGGQFVQVFVDRVRRFDPVLDAVETGYEYGREREVWV